MHFGIDCSSTQTTSQVTRGHRWVVATVLDSKYRITAFSECVLLSSASKRKGTKAHQVWPGCHNRVTWSANSFGLLWSSCSLVFSPIHSILLPGYHLCLLLAVGWTWMWFSTQEKICSLYDLIALTNHLTTFLASLSPSCPAPLSVSIDTQWYSPSQVIVHLPFLVHSAVAIFLNEKLNISLPRQQ